MIDFEAVEKQIAALLAPLRDRGILARALPNESGEAGFQVPAMGMVQIAIDSANKGDHPSLDFKVQKRIYSISCDIRLQHRRGESGLAQVADHLENLLHGARVPDFGTLEFSSYKELGRTDSHWVAQMGFTCSRVDRKQ